MDILRSRKPCVYLPNGNSGARVRGALLGLNVEVPRNEARAVAI
jgi:hypothetical protein